MNTNPSIHNYHNYHNYQFILIVATGRSGSTTLQRILNTIPKCNITGENDNTIIHLLNCYKSIKKTLTYEQMAPSCESLVERNIKPCWYNSFDFDKIKTQIQQLIINILQNNPQNTILGFKEIRYSKQLDTILLFRELFPNTKVICHYRENLDQQTNSGWWTPNDRHTIKEYTQEIISFYEQHKDFCYLTSLESILNIQKIQSMFSFLEQPFYVHKYNDIVKQSLE